MEKNRALQVINAEIATTTSSELSELIYELVIEKKLTAKTIRDKCIKADFNQLYKLETSVMDIYTTLSCSYDLSEDQIRYIIRK